MQCIRNAVESQAYASPDRLSNPQCGAAAWIKRARSAWDFVCGWFGDWPLAACPRRDPCRCWLRDGCRPRASRLRRRPALLSWRATAGSRPTPSVPISSPALAAGLGPEQEDAALKALLATGLFSDVRISHPGGRLVVTVVENPVINRVAFEGNKKAKDEQLSAEVQSKPRGTLSRPTVQADVQRIVEIYHRTGRFDVRSIRRSSSCRTTASIWCSRSRKATRPASRTSALSATRLLVEPPEGRHQDLREQLPQLPADHRHL